MSFPSNLVGVELFEHIKFIFALIFSINQLLKFETNNFTLQNSQITKNVLIFPHSLLIFHFFVCVHI